MAAAGPSGEKFVELLVRFATHWRDSHDSVNLSNRQPKHAALS